MVQEEVRTERMATGGEAVARLSDGRVVFVRDAVAQELVRVEITTAKKRFTRGHVVQVLQAGPSRVDLACGHALAGECGGCDWMHISADSQRAFKTQLVREQLIRLGGIDEPNVVHHSDPSGRRTTARCIVTGGRAGFRGRRSSDGFAAVECPATHPRLEELIVDGRFGTANQVTLSVGAATGERMAITDGPIDQVELPDDVRIGHTDSPAAVSITEMVAGQSFRISGGSFFQTSDHGAETLVAAVADGLHGSDGPVLDLYAGVGLLGAAAGRDRLHTAVESDRAAADDARYNLRDQVQVVMERVQRWQPADHFGAVIADPARAGLAAPGVKVLAATNADRLVLVSCDPASLGRDTALLLAADWRHDSSTVIDMFPNTSRIEVVSTFDR